MNFSTDKCLETVCAGGKVIPRTMEWMSSNAFSVEVKASAALIVANIARNGWFCGCMLIQDVVCSCTLRPTSVALARST